MERVQRPALAHRFLRRLGLGAGLLRIDEAEAVESRIHLLDPGEGVLHQIDGRELAVTNPARHLRRRHIAKIEVGHAVLPRANPAAVSRLRGRQSNAGLAKAGVAGPSGCADGGKSAFARGLALPLWLPASVHPCHEGLSTDRVFCSSHLSGCGARGHSTARDLESSDSNASKLVDGRPSPTMTE